MVKDGGGHWDPEVPISTDDRCDYIDREDNLSAAALDLSRKKTCESRAESPVLGRYFKLPDLAGSFEPDQPILDSSLQYVSVNQRNRVTAVRAAIPIALVRSMNNIV